MFFFFTQEPNLFWDLPKNEISWRFSVKIFMISHSSEDLRWFSSEDLLKIFRRKILWRFCFKLFSSKNIRKIYINFLQKIFITFLPKIFLKSMRDLHLRSLVDLHQISFWVQLKIFWLLFSFLVCSEDLRINSLKKYFFEIFWRIFIWRSQKGFYKRSSEAIKILFDIFMKIFLKFVLDSKKISKRSKEEFHVRSHVGFGSWVPFFEL